MISYPKPFDRKESYLVAINPLEYVKESKAELDKVVWPTRVDVIKLSVLVLAASVIVGAYIAGLDTLFTILVENFLQEGQ